MIITDWEGVVTIPDVIVIEELNDVVMVTDGSLVEILGNAEEA